MISLTFFGSASKIGDTEVTDLRPWDPARGLKEFEAIGEREFTR
jgi:hypothetical protein